jgi:glyoxylase-like metal-dependent hydrolase (beta-lactamase superfamily II)
MKTTLIALCMLAVQSLHADTKTRDNDKLEVRVFSAETANVNSFIFFDAVGSVVIDVTRTSKDALSVAKMIKERKSSLKIIFITHGHPDHFIGLGALKKEFPLTKIFVATQHVKEDIVRMAEIGARDHWLDDEPEMLPRSPKNPFGFDYENEIKVLKGNALELPAGDRLEVSANFPATEAQHETVLYSKSLESLFASDLIYNRVHLWIGSDATLQSIENWKTELNQLKNKYANARIKIFPGHGEPVGKSIIDADLEYLNDILKAVESAQSQEDAKSIMMGKYPDWRNSDFILSRSIKNLFRIMKKQS